MTKLATSILSYFLFVLSGPASIAQAAVSVPAAAAFSDPTVQSLIRTNDSYPATAKGKAILTCKKSGGNVQLSNFGPNSFILENKGDKRIAAVFIDLSDNMFSDIVFDKDGTGGDSVVKALTYDNGLIDAGAVNPSSYPHFSLKARDSSFNGAASFNPNDLSNVNNLFVNAVANTNKGNPKAGGGFRGELLLFTNFTVNKVVGFSGDMDPNSVAGLSKAFIDANGWDVGAVSGAEMIGSKVTVLFGDGSSAVSTMAADGSQAGSIAVLLESGHTKLAPVLTVNGISPGGSGIYKNAPTVIVKSSPGSKVLVTMAEGLNPVTNTTKVASGAITIEALVAARLAAQYPYFPVNNAYAFQHKLVTIPASGLLDVSALFTISSAKRPIAWTAVVVDGVGDPISETSSPIRMVYSAVTSAPSQSPSEAPTRAPAASYVGPPVSCMPQVTGFKIWNAATFQPATTTTIISNGQTICLKSNVKYSIEAMTNACPTKLVMQLTRPGTTVVDGRTERMSPYFLYGDRGYNFFSGKTLKEGKHTISAMPQGQTALMVKYDFTVQFCA